MICCIGLRVAHGAFWGRVFRFFSFYLSMMSNSWDSSYFFKADQARKLLNKADAKKLEKVVSEKHFMSVEIFAKVINNMVWAEQTTNAAQATEIRDMGTILTAFYYKVSQASRNRVCPWLAIFKMVDMLLGERTLHLDAVIAKSSKVEGFDATDIA